MSLSSSFYTAVVKILEQVPQPLSPGSLELSRSEKSGWWDGECPTSPVGGSNVVVDNHIHCYVVSCTLHQEFYKHVYLLSWLRFVNCVLKTWWWWFSIASRVLIVRAVLSHFTLLLLLQMTDASGQDGLRGQVVHTHVTLVRELELAGVWHLRVLKALSTLRTACERTAPVSEGIQMLTLAGPALLHWESQRLFLPSSSFFLQAAKRREAASHSY